MPSIDENSNMTDPDVPPDGTEIKVHKKCSCCPFGYHIHVDFVPFSKKMLSRDENTQRLQNLKALKEKWRSERQSMDKLLGFEAGPWQIKTSQERQEENWEFSSTGCSISFNLPNEPPLQPLNSTSGAGLDDAVIEFEDFLARSKRQDNKPSYSCSNDQNFHTFPRLSRVESRTKTKIPLKTPDPIFSNKEDFASTPTGNGMSMSPISTSTDDEFSIRQKAKIQALEEQILLIPKLIRNIVELTQENQESVTQLSEEKNKRRKLEEMIKSRDSAVGKTHQPVGEKVERRRRMQDASVGSTVTTRDVGISCIEEIGARTFGVGGRLDSGSFERDSASPTGSLNGRRRARTFETGTQVNESELLERCPSPPLLLIVEKHDFGSQIELDNIPTTSSHGLTHLRNEEPIPKVMRSIGCSIKPKTHDFGLLTKPLTRDEGSNTTKTGTRDKGIGTMPYLYAKASGDATKPQIIDELKSIGMNTVSRQMADAAVNTFTNPCVTAAAQTESVGNHHFGMQTHPTPPATPPRLRVDQLAFPPVSESMAASELRQGHGNSRLPEITGKYEEKRSRSTPEKSSSRAPESILCSSPKPALVRSNTYTKDIPLDEEESMEERPLQDDHPEMTPATTESKYLHSASFDLSIPTILERREAVKPSKEMQGALKVLNDALLRGKTTEHVTSAIGIILHEWFRVAGIKSSCAEDVEDYLDLYESYSPELLKYVVNMPDGNGNTAMHYAVSHGNFDVVSVLLDSNCCDINRTNRAGYTCIMLLSLANMSYERDGSIVGRLCNLGDVNMKATQHGQTALMLAASQGQLETCHALLAAGADMNIRDDDGSTALMCAAEHGHIRLVNYFVSIADCDLHITDNDGSTALNVAMEANHKDVGVTLYAHMHLMDNAKNASRRLSYPTYYAGRSSDGATSEPITRSAGNSPGTPKKLSYGIPPEETEEKEDAGASSSPQ